MPRGPRPVKADGTYHVIARGNRRQTVFADDYDRRLFLLLLADAAARHGWRCGAYCLLSNHFHLLIHTPRSGDDLAAGMHRLSGRYAQWFNDRYELSGHLFQGRFHSELIESEGHLLEVVRYVYLNPERAGLCTAPEAWPWSSYAATIGKAEAPTFLSIGMVLELFGSDRRRGSHRLAAFVDDSRRPTG